MNDSSAPEPDGPGDPTPPSDDAPELDLSGSSRPAPATPARPRRRAGWPAWLKAAIAAAVVLLGVAGTIAYRRYQEHRIVAISVSRAEQLVRADSWLGYHEAAALLGVRAARLDPVEAGALRALALAMLALDYRDDAAVAEANVALLEPNRAAQVPPAAQLAVAALALRDGRAGTAMDYLSRASETASSQVLAARVALMAGNSAMAGEALDRALSVDGRLPAALALKGDLLRRAGRGREARDAYAAALTGSAEALEAGLAGSTARAGATAPHARAALGLGKLALSRDGTETEAAAALARLVGDGTGTPQVERVRAALQLAALQGRAGDRTGSAATLARTALEGELRAWADRASGQLESQKGRYRVPDGTPAALVSASDDDPYVPPPPPPKPEAAPAPPALHGFKVHPAPVRKPARAAAVKKPAAKAPTRKQAVKAKPTPSRTGATLPRRDSKPAQTDR